MNSSNFNIDILIALTIKRLREKSNIDQNKMMHATKLTRSTWYKIESGQRSITVSELNQIVDVFGISIQDFYQEISTTDKLLLEKINIQSKKDETDSNKFIKFILTTLVGGALISFLLSLLMKKDD